MSGEWLKRIFGGENNNSAPAPKPDPNLGVGFGYKNSWFVVPTNDPDAALAGLGIEEAQPCTWADGMAAVQRQTGAIGTVFATPPQKGCVCLVLGLQGALDHPAAFTEMNDLLSHLSDRFGRAAYFGSYRVVSYVAWAIAEKGRETRIVSFVDGIDPVVTGPAVEEEGQVGLPFEAGQTADVSLQALGLNSEDAIYPGEQTPIDLSVAFGIDPRSFAGLDLGPGRLGHFAGTAKPS